MNQPQNAYLGYFWLSTSKWLVLGMNWNFQKFMWYDPQKWEADFTKIWFWGHSSRTIHSILNRFEAEELAANSAPDGATNCHLKCLKISCQPQKHAAVGLIFAEIVDKNDNMV